MAIESPEVVETLADESKETSEEENSQSRMNLRLVKTLEEVEASASSSSSSTVKEEEEEEDPKEALEAAAVDDGAVAIAENPIPEAENPNPEAESIMEPSFTVLKGSKKTTQNTRLTSGLPLKRKHHLCCRTCVGDDACSPLCNIMEDRQEHCLCQQARGIKEDDALGIVGDKKLVYMERVRATPHGNETVKYEDVPFTGEIQRCTVCCSDLGHRYLGTYGRHDGREMARSDETGDLMLVMGGPIQRYFLLDRKKLKIAKVTFSKAKQLGEN